MGAPVLGVVGGSGGVGASVLCAALARATSALLVDVDVDGGGIDVLLGVDQRPGARWSGLRVAGGELDPVVLRSGVCDWAGCAVLAADVSTLSADAVAQVVDVAASAGPVCLNLPRRGCPERAAAVARCDLVVVVARADGPGVVSAHAVASGLSSSGVALGVVVRPTAGDRVPDGQVARLVGARLLGRLPGGRRGYSPDRPPRRVRRLVDGVVAGLACDARGAGGRSPLTARIDRAPALRGASW